jgi:arginine decarboxylase
MPKHSSNAFAGGGAPGDEAEVPLGRSFVPSVPRRVFLTKGVGRDREKLASFEAALRDAGVAHCNLVRVSSILPPGARIIPAATGLPLLHPGEITYAVMAEIATNEPHQLVAASIGIAVPRDTTQHGYLSEHHAFGKVSKEAGDYAEDLAAQMLASTIGVPFDLDKAYDERKEQYRVGGLIVKTRNATQSAVGDKAGRWTTVLAAAVFV